MWWRAGRLLRRREGCVRCEMLAWRGQPRLYVQVKTGGQDDGNRCGGVGADDYAEAAEVG